MRDQRLDVAVDVLEQVERRIDAFDVAWHGAQPPVIADYLGGLTLEPSAEHRLVLELVAIDLENRWRTGDAIPSDDRVGPRPKLSAYAEYFRQPGSIAGLPGWILAEEYRARRLWGDAPNADRFIAEYPDQVGELVQIIPVIERELVADGAVALPRERFLPTDAADPRAPLPFTDYLLEQHLGTGAMGKVYRATQLSLQRPVAVKALLKSRQQDFVAVEQFLQEARLVGQLDHPNIVTVHGLGRFPNGGYFQVMQLVAGQDLAVKLSLETLPISNAVKIACEVAAAIQHAHEQGVVHCDLKPANVLLAPSGTTYVTDFGFAQLVDQPGQVQSQGGTVGYMAPEQIDPTVGKLTTAVDVYGLGALFYSLLTNRRPPQAGVKTVSSLQQEVGTGVPAALEAICVKCLRPRPADRYATVADVAVALRSWVDQGTP